VNGTVIEFGALKIENFKTVSESSMPISKIKSVYFIGIGGIGMSALARYFHSKGVKVVATIKQKLL
jgi:hypothetical protein